MKKVLPIIKPLVDEAECEAVSRVIRSGWLTQGPEVHRFETEFAEYVGAKHAVAVANCSVALHLALQVVGVSKEDEVLTVSHSFIATANSIRHCGAVPIFVDIDPETANVNPSLLENNISPRTKAILVVHQTGLPCDLTKILPLAKKYGLPVIEDAACAIGSEVKIDGRWERIGKPHGDLACFSFHPRKLLTTGDGGMITTGDAQFAERLRHLRQHGMSINDQARHQSKTILFESYLEMGFNYRLTDVQAAIGREQLKKIDIILGQRRKQAEIYYNGFKEVPLVTLPKIPSFAKTNWQSFWIRLPDGVDQKEFMAKALEEGITTRRGVMCAHREPAYTREPWSCTTGHVTCSCPSQCWNLTESEKAQDRNIILPLYHDMTESDQRAVIDFVSSYLESQLVSESFVAKAA